MDFLSDWEKNTLLQLYKEYAYILRERKVKLRPAALSLNDSETRWGEWNSLTRTISLSRRLIRQHNWLQVTSILRHEMAHQLAEEILGLNDDHHAAHGELFSRACGRLGVTAEFSRANICLEASALDWRETASEVSERMMEKVRKLLNLATSTNEHEALLAMEKVREIYAKYNLDEADATKSEGFVHLMICHKKKRIEAHESRTISILVEHFFVQVITSRLYDPATAEHHAAFEIIGTRENVLMADYVYHFLLQQIEGLLKGEAKRRRLSRVQRKSFRLGILSGFSAKLRLAEKPAAPGREASVVSRALENFKGDSQLDDYLAFVYPRLHNRSRGSQRIDPSIFSHGQTAGHSITLNRPLHSPTERGGRLLK